MRERNLSLTLSSLLALSLLSSCGDPEPTSTQTPPRSDMSSDLAMLDLGTPHDMSQRDAAQDMRASEELGLADEDAAGDLDEEMSSSPPPELTFTWRNRPLPGDIIPRQRTLTEGRAVFEGDVSGHSASISLQAHIIYPDRESLAAPCEAPVDAAITIAPPDRPGEAVPFRLQVLTPVKQPIGTFNIYLCLPGEPAPLHVATELMVGDIVLVTGQSNAVARMQPNSTSAEMENASPYIRTLLRDGVWHQATADVGIARQSAAGVPLDMHGEPTAAQLMQYGPLAFIGQWPMRMARVMLNQQQVAVGVLNGAYGGQKIDVFLPDPADAANPETSYGALYERLEQRELRGGVRAILWYQGESDRDTPPAQYKSKFNTLLEAWRRDYPNLEQIYVFQVRQGCSNNDKALSPIQEALRELAEGDAAITLMTTTGINAHDGCHYLYANGYKRLGNQIGLLLAQTLGAILPAAPEQTAGAPRLSSARLSGNKRTVVLKFALPDTASQALKVPQGNAPYFSVWDTDGSRIPITLVEPHTNPDVHDTVFVRLERAVTGNKATVSYHGHPGSGPWITIDATGVGIPTFHKVEAALP